MALDTYSLYARFDVGPKLVPTVDTLEVNTTSRIAELQLLNPTAGVITAYVTDNQSPAFYIIPPIAIAANGGTVSFKSDDQRGRLMTLGIRWSATAPNLQGYIRGVRL